MKNNFLKITNAVLLNRNQLKTIKGSIAASLAGEDKTYNCGCKNTSVEWSDTYSSAEDAAASIPSKCDDGQGYCF